MVILSAAFALGLAELFLRAFYPQPLYTFEQGLFVNSPDYGYQLTPHVEKRHTQPEYSYWIKSNSRGFRGREPDPSAGYRVLILGDSFGMGQGVAEGENLCELAKLHYDSQGQSVDIFNTSVSGYAGINEVMVLRRQIKEYTPNLVVLFFCWNDIGVTKSLMVQDGYLVTEGEDRPVWMLKKWLNAHSHLYCLVKRFFHPVGRKWEPGTDRPSETEGAGRAGATQGNDSAESEGIDVAGHYIQEMKEITDANRARFVAVILPSGAGPGGESREFIETRKHLLGEMADSGIEYRDWSTVLPDHLKDRLYFKKDRHLNKDGHAYFSSYLVQIIEEKRSSRNR